MRKKTKKIGYAQNRKLIGSAVLAFLLICGVTGTLFYKYYQVLQETVQAETNGYLNEISSQMGENANRIINDNFSVLATVATVIKNTNVTQYPQIQPIVKEQQIYWNYQDIFLVDKYGIAYDAYGKKVTLKNDTYLQETIGKGIKSMSSSQVINGTESVVFAIPVSDITVDGVEIRALVASYESSTFDQILSMSAFDGQAYAYIIEKNGSIVIRSSAKEADQFGYNVINSLSRADMDKGNSFETVKFDISAGRSGSVGFTLNGVREYMTYTPIESPEWSLLTFIPVEVVSARSEMFINLTLMMCGFLTLMFSLLVVIIAVAFVQHKRKLEQIAYVDPVTGGNTVQRFYRIVRDGLHAEEKASEQSKFAIIYINIEKFKMLNEQFGRGACDEMLCSVEKGISSDLTGYECIGRIAADNFCVFTEYQDIHTMILRFEKWYQNAAKLGDLSSSLWPAPIVAFGVYEIREKDMPFSQMIDRAKLAIKETTRALRGRIYYGVYDDATRKLLVREKQIEDMMGSALANGEFEVYLQPKYFSETEKIGGAEALVRWNSLTEGKIMPDDFIPVFERNGFVVHLDHWVFEQVCKTISGWIDDGREPVKISVNCSRVHLRNENFLKQYVEICSRCNTPPEFIEIELTENVVFEDVESLSVIIDKIHDAGFGCSMDDFGSGYSSLNLIKDIPVDTLKLDKIFFRGSDDDIVRTKSVVGSIISMSKALKLDTVAEGVETRTQVDMLKRLGCNYIQGYYFAKPMPIFEFEQLLFDLPQ